VPLEETDNTQCHKAGNLFTSNLSTNYLHLFPDLHHIFVCLTQIEMTCIVNMASVEIHRINLATEQPTSKTTAFTASSKPHLSMKAGNNDVWPQETVHKDDDANKKRRAVEAAPPKPKASGPKVNNKPNQTQPDTPHGQASRPSDLSGSHGQASLPDPSQLATARDQIEVWIDDETTVEEGFICTGRKPYWPPLPNLYMEPEVDDDLLDAHNWLYQEHGKAI
jgi:hypothetical protein